MCNPNGNSLTWKITTTPPEREKLAWSKRLGVEPFPSREIQVKGAEKGFARAAQKVELTKLRVIVGTEAIPAGSSVFVRGDYSKNQQAGEVMDFEGTPTIFIPEDWVLAVERDKKYDLGQWINPGIGTYPVGGPYYGTPIHGAPVKQDPSLLPVNPAPLPYVICNVDDCSRNSCEGCGTTVPVGHGG